MSIDFIELVFSPEILLILLILGYFASWGWSIYTINELNKKTSELSDEEKKLKNTAIGLLSTVVVLTVGAIAYYSYDAYKNKNKTEDN